MRVSQSRREKPLKPCHHAPRSIRKRVIAGAPGSRQIRRTVDQGFRIELHQKDLNRALTSARQIGGSLPNTVTAQERFNACAAHGGSAWGHSGMVPAFELMAKHGISTSPKRDDLSQLR